MIEKVKGTSSGLLRLVEKWAKKLPIIRKKIDSKTESMIDNLKSSVKPYAGKFNTYSNLPPEGRSRNEILNVIKEIAALNLAVSPLLFFFSLLLS